MSDQDLALFFATPVLITADTEIDEMHEELIGMKIRSLASADLINGKITVDEFLQVLEHTGIDIDRTVEHWDSGYSLMGNRWE